MWYKNFWYYQFIFWLCYWSLILKWIYIDISTILYSFGARLITNITTNYSVIFTHTIPPGLTPGTYNLYFGIATLSPADTTSYPSYISNPNYNDGHGNSNYTITQSVNTIVGCVINSINNSRFFKLVQFQFFSNYNT